MNWTEVTVTAFLPDLSSGAVFTSKGAEITRIRITITFYLPFITSSCRFRHMETTNEPYYCSANAQERERKGVNTNIDSKKERKKKTSSRLYYWTLNGYMRNYARIYARRCSRPKRHLDAAGSDSYRTSLWSNMFLSSVLCCRSESEWCWLWKRRTTTEQGRQRSRGGGGDSEVRTRFLLVLGRGRALPLAGIRWHR